MTDIDIITDYQTGMSIPDIKTKFNLNYRDIKRIFEKYNIEVRTMSEINKLRKRSSKLIQYREEIIELYNNNSTLEQISKKFNCAQTTVKYWLKKWGITLRTKSESGLFGAETRKQQWIKKYGVEHPMHVSDIFTDRAKKLYKYKIVTIENVTFKLQGFEPQAIDHILRLGVSVRDIKSGKDVPRISYNYNTKNKVYYPDLYVENTNTIYEVKCLYTYNQHKRRNIAKARATLKAGYKHITLIYDNKGRVLVDILIA